jgi:hypothetical protein
MRRAPWCARRICRFSAGGLPARIRPSASIPPSACIRAPLHPLRRRCAPCGVLRSTPQSRALPARRIDALGATPDGGTETPASPSPPSERPLRRAPRSSYTGGTPGSVSRMGVGCALIRGRISGDTLDTGHRGIFRREERQAGVTFRCRRFQGTYLAVGDTLSLSPGSEPGMSPLEVCPLPTTHKLG